MKIIVKHRFKYTFDNVKTHQLDPGEYEVPRQVSEPAAKLAIQFGAAVIVRAPVAKVAPENKATKAPETKKGRGKSKKTASEG